MPQGPPPHRSLLSVRSHSRGARVPSGVFASLQGLLWPDFFFSGPHNPFRSPKGALSAGGPSRPPEAERIHQETLLKLGEAQGEQAEKTARPKSSLSLEKTGHFQGYTPKHAPCASFHNLLPTHPEQPPAPGTTPQPGTHRAPMRSATPSFHKHTGVHTHNVAHTQGRNGESLGCEAGRLLCCSCPRSGKVRPLLWERPCEMMAGVGIPGAQPQGNNLPGHLALLVPSRQCLPPSPPSST